MKYEKSKANQDYPNGNNQINLPSCKLTFLWIIDVDVLKATGCNSIFQQINQKMDFPGKHYHLLLHDQQIVVYTPLGLGIKYVCEYP